jgi:hypothetical protein
MADKGFLNTPMDYDSGPVNPSAGGTKNGEPGFPTRSAHPGGVDEVTYETIPDGGSLSITQVGVPPEK